MADFRTPFGSLGSFRLPTNDERQQGFQCGPADRELFTGLFRQIQAEIGTVVDEAGLIPNDTQDDWLYQAIQALISAATGGNPAGYVLMTQARARLPIFPEVLNADGRIVVTSPSAGTVRLPGGVDFLHRGIFTVQTTQTDFPTDPSKTYHLRWDPTNGFRLRDLADAGYNAGAALETDVIFDTALDDMLVARVITNSSNVAAITNLANKNRLHRGVITSKTVTRLTTANIGGRWICPFDAIALDWARTPEHTASASRSGYGTFLTIVPEEPEIQASGTYSDGTGAATASVTRYGASYVGLIDTNTQSVSREFGLQLSAMFFC